MIDLNPEQLAEVKRILAEHAPGCEVLAFGSRVDGSARPASDLDLVLRGPGKLDWRFLERLKDAFSASDLPFMVDVVDWHDAGEEVKAWIAKSSEVIQTSRLAP